MSKNPVAAENLFFEGTRRMSEGDAAGAEGAFRQALGLAPDFAEPQANLGLLLDQGRRWQEAEQHYGRALHINPLQMRTHLNLGSMLLSQKRFVEAESAYRRALALDPDAPGARSNLGVLLACLQREEEAEQCYRAALALAPDHARARFNLAYLLLRQGRYAEGWECLEARDWYAPFAEQLGCPRWQGESLQGKSLLIGFEAGHGDMIQFCRYAALAKAGGAALVSLLCQPGLRTLLGRLAGVDQSIALDQPLPACTWDYWTVPLSLPFLFRTRLDSIPADLPYLRAKPELTRKWAGIMAGSPQELRVGLAWKGNPRFENDADRSLPSLATLAPLGGLAGVRFFSLQKGAGEAEAAAFHTPLPLVELGSRIEDFDDTAAIVMNLDLVVSVDTALAHLAGALGKPCWVLLPAYQTDWRWLKDRKDSPWYPGVIRLFRQQAAGDWGTVIVELMEALQIMVTANIQAGATRQLGR